MVNKTMLFLVGGLLAMSGQVWAGDAAAGQTKSEPCAACHGDDGKDGDKPIAGMAEADIVKAIKDYQSGARDNKKMVKASKDLTDEDIADLAAYYSSLK
jgi:cytochrome c553